MRCMALALALAFALGFALLDDNERFGLGDAAVLFCLNNLPIRFSALDDGFCDSL